MTDSPKMPDGTGQRPDAVVVPSSGRRRMLKAGISATPVVMTVISRPVLAVGCDSPSGFTSLSQSHPGPGTCSGHAPTYWSDQTHWGEWPPTFTPATLFVARFPTGGPWLSAMASDTLGYVIDSTMSPSGIPYGLARLIIAAYFNAGVPILGTSTLLSQVTVQHIWLEWSTTGSFSPRTGASWKYDEIVAYLPTTMS
jgi:hypothetical protein